MLMSKLVSALPGTEISAIWWYEAAVLSANAGVAALPARMTTAATTSGLRNLAFMVCSSPVIGRAGLSKRGDEGVLGWAVLTTAVTRVSDQPREGPQARRRG